MSTSTSTEPAPTRNALHVRAPHSLTKAIRDAAAREFTTPSEYARRALIAKLRSDGFDPAAYLPAGAPAVEAQAA